MKEEPNKAGPTVTECQGYLLVGYIYNSETNHTQGSAETLWLLLRRFPRGQKSTPARQKGIAGAPSEAPRGVLHGLAQLLLRCLSENF